LVVAALAVVTSPLKAKAIGLDIAVAVGPARLEDPSTAESLNLVQRSVEGAVTLWGPLAATAAFGRSESVDGASARESWAFGLRATRVIAGATFGIARVAAERSGSLVTRREESTTSSHLAGPHFSIGVRRMMPPLSLGLHVEHARLQASAWRREFSGQPVVISSKERRERDVLTTSLLFELGLELSK